MSLGSVVPGHGKAGSLCFSVLADRKVQLHNLRTLVSHVFVTDVIFVLSTEHRAAGARVWR